MIQHSSLALRVSLFILIEAEQRKNIIFKRQVLYVYLVVRSSNLYHNNLKCKRQPIAYFGTTAVC